MSEVWLGVIAVLAGVLFCFFGAVAMRNIISIWGAFVGFALGATLAAGWTGAEPLGDVVGWIAALLGAFLFAGLAYAYYAFAVIVAVASVGYGLGGLAAVALGAGDGVAAIVGVVLAVVLAAVALATGLPHLLLVVLSATGGATAIVAGVMLLVGAVDSGDFAGQPVRDVVVQDWWWTLAWVVLAVAGFVAQSRVRRPARAQEAWAAEGTPQRR
nr:DUF4203 domain-containing protein [Actinomycetales bacterium]